MNPALLYSGGDLPLLLTRWHADGLDDTLCV